MMKSRVSPDSKAILRHLSHGLRVFNWVSSLSVAGLLGAAGFVLALKNGRFRNFGSLRLFSGEEDAGDDSSFVPGLQNLGNNCFLNVILQSLASCEDFRVYVQRVIEEWQALAVSEQDETLPLSSSLNALLEELSTIGSRRHVSSPRKVMQALALYVHNFNLTSQQDAAEALLHLMSSLQEELTDCYIPTQITLSEVITCRSSKILSPCENQSSMDLGRWQKHFLGPFDGILGSVFMCQTCASQISLEFQFFHTLPLSPVLDSGSNIVFGCALKDSLKKFFVAEKVENYFCRRCWHSAALKYLLVRGAAETEIEKLRSCSGQDDKCDCSKNVLGLETLPWSNNFSHTLKQLSIARCPKLLCIQLQRASLNMFGESLKLRGHIAFPLVLDLSPYTISAIGMNPEESLEKGKMKKKTSLLQKASLQFDGSNNLYAGVLNSLRLAEQQSEFPCSGSPSDAEMVEQSSGNHSLYRLVAVVEHFGKSGSGHYTVYRSVKLESGEEEEDCGNWIWFSISDSEVARVSESEALGAEASLLFYERM